MAKLPISPVDTAYFLLEAGFVGWQVVRFGAIAAAESALNAYAINVNHIPGSIAHRSLDIGLLQINSFFWLSESVSISLLLDPAGNCRTAFDIFKYFGGLRDPVKGYNAWASYRNRTFVPFHSQAYAAAEEAGAV